MGFPARRQRRLAVRQVRFRFLDLWIKFGKMISKSPAPPKAGLGEQSSSSGNFEFVALNIAPQVGLEPAR